MSTGVAMLQAEAAAMAAETQVPARFWEVMNQRKVFIVFTPSKRSKSLRRTCIVRWHCLWLALAGAASDAAAADDNSRVSSEGGAATFPQVYPHEVASTH